MSVENLTLSELKAFFQHNEVWKVVKGHCLKELEACLFELEQPETDHDRTMFLRGEICNLRAVALNMEQMIQEELELTIDNDPINDGIIDEEEEPK